MSNQEIDDMPLFSSGGVIENNKVEEHMDNKYVRRIRGEKIPCYVCIDKATIKVDVYDVLKAFDVKCPALQHLTKKALCVGIRGHKDEKQDLLDIIKSAKRALELYENEKG